MGISRFRLEQEPVTATGMELVFVVYRDLFYGAASVRYSISSGTATEGSTYDDSLDGYTGILTFADKEIWKAVRIQTLAGTGTVFCTLHDPVGGKIVNKYSVGSIFKGQLRFFLPESAGNASGSSFANAMAYGTGNPVRSWIRSSGGRVAVLQRGQTYDDTRGEVIASRHLCGTYDLPSIVCASGVGVDPIVRITGQNNAWGCSVEETEGTTDTRFIIRDINFQPPDTGNSTFGSIIYFKGSGDGRKFHNLWVERCSFTNPNRYAGFRNVIQALAHLCTYGLRIAWNTFSDLCWNYGIVYDNKTGDFTAGHTVSCYDATTGLTEVATTTILQIVDKGDGTGVLRIDPATLTGVFEENGNIDDPLGGAATINMPKYLPYPPNLGVQNPHRVNGEGGSGILSGDQENMTIIGNKFVNVGQRWHNRTWTTYLQGRNLTFTHNVNMGPGQGHKFRYAEGFRIQYNYSLMTSGSVNFNFNYSKTLGLLSDGVISHNVAEGANGFYFAEADSQAVSETTTQFRNLKIFNNFLHVYAHDGSYDLLGTCLSWSTTNQKNVNFFNNTLLYDGAAGADFTALSLAFGTLIDEKVNIKNNIIKRINSAASPSHGLIRGSNVTALDNINLDGNLYDIDSGDLITYPSTNYTDIAAFRADYPAQDANSVEGNVSLTTIAYGKDIGISIVPDAGGAADGAGISGLLSNDISQKLRVQPPTIGAWELNDVAGKGKSDK